MSVLKSKDIKPVENAQKQLSVKFEPKEHKMLSVAELVQKHGLAKLKAKNLVLENSLTETKLSVTDTTSIHNEAHVKLHVRVGHIRL
jgi:hypothetical protein